MPVTPDSPQSDVDFEEPEGEEDVPAEFQEIFSKFREREIKRGQGLPPGDAYDDEGGETGDLFDREFDEDDVSENEGEPIDLFDVPEGNEANKKEGLSKKAKKKLKRPSVAQLKQLCSAPEVVESWDTTAPDPLCLVYLKSLRNTVPVPAHWCHKRKYLRGKRGLERTLFRLPPHIEATKIAEIRSAIEEKDEQKTLRQKMRERVRPRHRKMNIDYQVLHDAFFKYAVKPRYTSFGDLYFEGKELEVQMRKFHPGKLSERAREALGMHTPLDPPPWLHNMQRYGPPPSYPDLITPGVNGLIPPGANLGFQPGGWGKLPTLDQLAVWGVPARFDEEVTPAPESVTNGGLTSLYWGDLRDAASEDEEDGEDTGDGDAPAGLVPDGVATPADELISGVSTPMILEGTSSVITASALLLQKAQAAGTRTVGSMGTTGLDTPASFDIVKSGFLSTDEPVAAAPKPYTVLESVSAPAQPGAIFASETVYNIPQE